MKLTRRTVLPAAALATRRARCSTRSVAAARLAPGRRRSPDRVWRHGLSLFGDLKYPAGFKHFDYVNPNAPKGGTVRTIAIGTYDNFNMVVVRREGQHRGRRRAHLRLADGGSLDEVSTEYGLVAEAVSHPTDFSAVTYRLRAEARWHDGKPMTADDVIFSFEVVQEASSAICRPTTAMSSRPRRPASAR